MAVNASVTAFPDLKEFSTGNVSEYLTMAVNASVVTAFPDFTELSTGNLSDPTTVSYQSNPSATPSSYDYEDYAEDIGMYLSCRYERHEAHFLPVVYTLFFLMGLLGNFLVIWVIASRVRLRSMTDVCLLNLAISDLLLVCTLPFLAHQARDQWAFGDAMCKVVLGVYHIVFYCGIFFICLMSIDRYLAVVHAVNAMRARTRFSGMIAAAITWIASFLASFPDLIFLQERHDGYKTYCYPVYPPNTNSSDVQFWRTFSLLKMNVVGLFFPIIIMSVCYSQIICTLLSSQSSKKRAIRLVLIVVLAFFFCWIPYNVVSFFKALELLHIYAGCNSSNAIILAMQITEAVAYFHSCLNPILYVFVGEKFRRHLLRLINRAPCRVCQAIKVLMPQDRINGSVYSQTTSLDEQSTAV